MTQRNQEQSPAQLPQQGSMFEEVVKVSGTDPELMNRTVTYEVAPEGAYPQTETPQKPRTTLSSDRQKAFEESVHASVITHNRHMGQLDKHSALVRDGSREHIVVGDYLDDHFGPVTHLKMQNVTPPN
jgi:hypothetical protein